MIRDVDRQDTTAESKAETDEQQLGVRNAAMYDDIQDLAGFMFQTTIDASLKETSMMGSSAPMM